MKAPFSGHEIRVAKMPLIPVTFPLIRQFKDVVRPRIAPPIAARVIGFRSKFISGNLIIIFQFQLIKQYQNMLIYVSSFLLQISKFYISFRTTNTMQKEEENKKGSKFQELRKQIDQQLRAKWEDQQSYIRKLIVEKNVNNIDSQNITLIAGVDLSAQKNNPDVACVGLVVYNVKEKKIAYEDYEIILINQPYVPGFLAFRQIPPLYELFNRLKKNKPQMWPELILVDGNGILHNNMCGLACHLGVLLDTPTAGVGKTLFYIDGLGKEQVKKMCEQKLQKQGDYCLLTGKSGKNWGVGLRMTKQSKNPVFVSVGHKIELETAMKCVLKVSQYRVPEPIRIADKKSRQLIEKYKLDQKNPPVKLDMIYLKK